MSTSQVGEPAIGEMRGDATMAVEYTYGSMIHEDSLEMACKNHEEYRR